MRNKKFVRRTLSIIERLCERDDLASVTREFRWLVLGLGVLVLTLSVLVGALCVLLEVWKG